MHSALCVALGHLLVQNAAARSHPLYVAGCHLAPVAETVAVLHRASEHVGDGLDAAVRMPGKASKIVLRVIVAKIVQEQEGIEVLCLPEAEGTL
jgi:hypothetical protein